MISKSNNKIILLITAFAVFLATFNETFLNVAFDVIGRDLGVGFDTMQWLATAYMLGAAIMVPVSAFMYRRVPTKILFLSTVACFIIGSLVAGLSTTFIVLLIGRVIQALGSGMLIPVAMNIVLQIAPKEKLGAYMGTMGAMTTLGPSLSLIVAGAFLSFTDWHVLFAVFGGLCIILFILAAIFLGNIATLSKPKLDILSVILISIALIGVLYGISTVFTCWWIALITFVVGAFALVWFIIRQKKIATPLINLAPFKVKAFNLGILINILTLIMIFALNIVVPKYLLAEKGVIAIIASLALFPAIFLSCIVAPIAGKIYDKHGIKVLLPLGFSLMAIFSILLAFFITTPSIILIALMYIPIIVGSAFIVGPIQTHALSYLKPEESPHGVTIFSTGFQIAGCIGASLFASLYAYSCTTSTANDAFLLVGLIVAGVAVIGLIISLLLNRIKRKDATLIATATPLTDKVADIMLHDVYTIDHNAPIIEVMRLFVNKKISGCPIVDDDKKFIGFISDGDIIRFLAQNNTNFKSVYSYAVTNGAEGQISTKLRELLTMPVTEIAGKDLFYIQSDQSISEACNIMATMHKKKVPVMQNGEMVGIVTRSDITKKVMDYSISAYDQDADTTQKTVIPPQQNSDSMPTEATKGTA